jgi:hypothetical protein
MRAPRPVFVVHCGVGLALGSALRLRSVLRVRPRAISVPLTWNCTELAALDAICRGLSVCNYVRECFRIPLSPPYFQLLSEDAITDAIS